MPDSPIGRELRRRLFRLVLPSYILVVLVAAGAVWLNDKESDARQAEDHAAEIARSRSACESRNDFRLALRELIEVATSPSDAVAVGLTSLESYPALDPETKAFVAELEQQLAAASGTGSAEELAAFAESLKPEDCAAIGTEAG